MLIELRGEISHICKDFISSKAAQQLTMKQLGGQVFLLYRSVHCMQHRNGVYLVVVLRGDRLQDHVTCFHEEKTKQS